MHAYACKSMPAMLEQASWSHAGGRWHWAIVVGGDFAGVGPWATGRWAQWPCHGDGRGLARVGGLHGICGLAWYLGVCMVFGGLPGFGGFAW